LPISAADSIAPAFEHMKQQLFRPFRLGQWTRLALVGLLAGELGGNGLNGRFPAHGGNAGGGGFPGPLGIDHALLIALAAAVLIAAFAIGLILMYVGSVMRFVLFDGIVAKEVHIRASWSRRLIAGWRYFVWKLLYVVLTFAGIALLVGVPAAYGYASGWFREPKAHLPVLILGGIFLFLVMFAFVVLTAVIMVLTKDFVIPQMALDNVDVFEGWHRLWPMMMAEKGAYAAYIGLKIVLAIVAGIAVGIATLILGLIFVLPTAGLGILAFLTGKSAGLTWNAYTITLAIVVGCILLAIFLYLVALLSVPVIVFFPAYSLYFFAGRYPRLSAVLYPAPPAPVIPPGTVPVSP
jgi:hypothetical protein